jgi:copper homeostasis protein
MIRCRVGDFCYSDSEMETMIEDLKKFVEMDVDGIVFGALTPEVN